MKVPLIKDKIEQFVVHINTKDVYQYGYLWEAYDTFNKHWDIDAVDFEKMFSDSFHSKQSNRLWKREDYFPKQMMEHFLAYDKEFVRSMFKDLLNEKKDLNMRISRFISYCDQLLMILQRKNMKFADHYHNDHQMIYAYLTFIYPEKYTFYNYNMYISSLNEIGGKNIPPSHDGSKFVIFSKVLKTYLLQNEEFLSCSNRMEIKEKWNESFKAPWLYLLYSYISKEII